MKIAVVGSGGVGGYIYFALHKAGMEVTLLATPKSCDILQKDGLTLVTPAETTTLTPNIATVLTRPYDLIIVAVKSYDYEAIIPGIAKGIGPETTILPVSNGLDNGKKLAKLLGVPCEEGAVYIVAHKQAPGVIEKQNDTFYLLHTGDERIKAVFDRAGLKNKNGAGVEFSIFKKYLFIAAFASLTSFYGCDMPTVATEHEKLLREVLAEICALHQGCGQEQIDKTVAQAKKLPSGAKTSMQRDFEQGDKTELEALCGYVAKQNPEARQMRRIYEALSKKGEQKHG